MSLYEKYKGRVNFVVVDIDQKRSKDQQKLVQRFYDGVIPHLTILGKKGEVLDVNAAEPPSTELQVVWRAKRNVPKKPSLLLVGESLFGIDDNGVATCWEAKTGRTFWNERIGGNYSAAPLAAEGRLYFFSEEGKTTVVAADREFKKLAENQLGDGFMASPAVSGKALFLRTRTELYRIEE